MKNVYYRPPKVKAMKKATVPPPEWNSDVNDLGKYKLSSTDIVSKLFNSYLVEKEN
jgi:hypothetical protein